MKRILFQFGALSVLFFTILSPAAGDEVFVCDDEAGFPPFAYRDPVDRRIIRFSVELVQVALSRPERTVHVDFLPWNRCLAEGKTGAKYSIVLDATTSEERNRDYLVSDPVYTIKSIAYYLPSRFVSPPVLVSARDWERYTFGGILGYNYAMYPIPVDRLDQTARSEAARFQMLREGRFDFVVGEYEAIQGFVRLGQLDIRGLVSLPLPSIAPKPYHFLVSRTGKGGELLLAQLNEGLKKARSSGVYLHLLERYGIAGLSP